MRIALTLVLLLVVGAIAGAFTLTRLISATELRAQIIEETESATGRAVTIGGAVDFGLLPTPTLSFANARFLAAEGEAAPSLEVDRVDLGVAPLALLRGRLEVEAVRLVRPRLRFEPADDQAVGFLEVIGGHAFMPAWTGVGQLSVIDGEVVVGRLAATALILERVDLDVEARADRGPFSIQGSFVHRGEPFAIEARLGRLTDDPNTTLQLNLETAAAATTDLALDYHGIVSLDRLSYLRGRVAFAGSAFDAALGLLAPPGWDPPPGAAPDGPFELEAVIESQDGEGQLGDLQVAIGQLEGRGRLGFSAGQPPHFDLQLDVPRIDAAWLGADAAPVESLAALTGRASGEIDLSIDALVRGDALARGVRLTLGLEPGDAIEVRQARAVLPGDTDVSVTGRMSLAPEPRLDGQITAVTDRFGELLAALDPSVPADAAARFRTLSLAAGLTAAPDGVGLRAVDARLDASRIEGSLFYGRGEQPLVRADLAADRLSLDRYAPGLGAAGLAALLLDRVGRADLDLHLRLERLSVDQERWTDVVLDAGASAGRLTLERLRGGLAGDTEVQVEGWLEPAREQADLAATLRSGEPGPLLRRFGMAPPVSLLRLGALEIEATAKGWASGAEISARSGLGGLRSTLAGRVMLDDDNPLQGELEVELSHPDYAALLADLGLDAPAAPGGEPLAGTGRIRLGPYGKSEVTGQIGLGVTRVTGQVGLLPEQSGGRIEARLSLAEPRLETLLPLVALTGYRLDPGMLGRYALGDWPRVRLDAGALRGLDGRVLLSGKGGLAGEGLEAELSGEDGLIRLERSTLRLAAGEVDVEATLNAREKTPRLALALQTRGVAVADLLQALGVPPALTGRLDLYGEVAGIGETPHDLLRSLAGDVALSVRDGTVELPQQEGTGAAPGAVPLDLLEAQFDVRRGLAELTRLDLETPHGGWRGEGLIDLLVWIVDLSLIAGGQDGRRIRIVGPPDRPQVRLIDPDAVAPAQ